MSLPFKMLSTSLQVVLMTKLRLVFAVLLVLFVGAAAASAQNSTSNTSTSPPSNVSNVSAPAPAPSNGTTSANNSNSSSSSDPAPEPQPDPAPQPEPDPEPDTEPEPFPSSPEFVRDCLPVGSSTAAASVHVCGDRLEDGKVIFDVYAQESTTVFIAVADLTTEEGSVGTVERTVPAGNSTVSVVSPSPRGARWSLGNLNGFAFGTVGSDGRLGPAPTWFEFLSGVSGAVAAVLLNVLVAVLIVLYGKRDYIKQIW